MVLVPSFVPSRFQAASSYGPRLGVGRYQGYVPPAAQDSAPALPQPAPEAPAPAPVQVGAAMPDMPRERDGSDGAPGSVADGNFGVDAGRDLGMSFGQFATNTLNGLGTVGTMGLGTLGAALIGSEITGNPMSFGLYSAVRGRGALQDLADLGGQSDATPLSGEIGMNVAPATVDALLAAPNMYGGLISTTPDPYSDPMNAFDPGIGVPGFGGGTPGAATGSGMFGGNASVGDPGGTSPGGSDMGSW